MINELDIHTNFKSEKTVYSLQRIETYLEALKRHGTPIPEPIEQEINKELALISSFDGSESELQFKLFALYDHIKKMMAAELKLVPKNHYQSIWMSLGLSLFGLPVGLLWYFMTDSVVYIALGLPIGLLIGMSVGINLDRKAEREGRQLDFTPR